MENFKPKGAFPYNLHFAYHFSFLKWGLINPSRPPFFKGRRVFLNGFNKKFLSFPLWDEGGFDGFSKS